MSFAHITSPGHEPREVRAPRGTELNARSWQTEAPLRMLMNNLDPEVAERPDDLVVYGGTGRAARSWEAFDAIVDSLKDLAEDETLLVQSGKPVGIIRTNVWAPRVLIANSNLVGDWANWPEFRKLEDEGLMMYGQMTAGSWIYIATQGILQGTFETFAAVAKKRFNGTLKGTITLTAGCGGMGGAQPLAVTLNGGVALVVDVDRTRLERRRSKRYLDEIADDLDAAVARARPLRLARRCRLVLKATPRLCSLICCAATRLASSQSTSLPTRPRRTIRSRTSLQRSRSRIGTARPRLIRLASPRSPANPWPPTSRRWSVSKTPALRYSITATASAMRPATLASSAHSTSRASSPRTFALYSAKAWARSVGLRFRATLRTSA